MSDLFEDQQNTEQVLIEDSMKAVAPVNSKIVSPQSKAPQI